MKTLRKFTNSLLLAIAPELTPLAIGHASEFGWSGLQCSGFTGPGTAETMNTCGNALIINDIALTAWYRSSERQRRDSEYAESYIGVALHEAAHLCCDAEQWRNRRWFASETEAMAACAATIAGSDREEMPATISTLVELVHHQPRWIRACMHFHCRARKIGGLGLRLSHVITHNYGGVCGPAIRHAIGSEVFERTSERISEIITSPSPAAWVEHVVRPYARTLGKALEPLNRQDQRRVAAIVSDEVKEFLL